MSETKVESLGPVRTLKELERLVRRIRRKHRGQIILFRGQRTIHDTIRSGRARPNIIFQKDVEAGWRSLAGRMLGLTTQQNSNAYAKAILQHYGMATHFVDLTAKLEVAAWFATRTYQRTIMLYAGSALREFEHVHYEPAKEGVGYVLVLAIPKARDLQNTDRLFDLSALPSGCVRPHRQNGWLMLDRPPTEPSPNDFWVATISVDCKRFSTSFKTTDMFPEPADDPAFANLLSLPFVQLPSAYLENAKRKRKKRFRKPSKAKTLDRSLAEMCFATRALMIPEYGDGTAAHCLDHKWADVTVYEPHHMRMWKAWRFEIGSVHPGVNGDIKDTVKITLSPDAKRVLSSSNRRKYAWPRLGTDSLFFTFAALDHDKVIDHCPPYHGVWLHRDEELIIETPAIANDSALSLTAGHSYFLRVGKLQRQQMAGSCKCGNPESHDKRVRCILRLPSLIEDGTLILLPHPRLANLGWYVVVTGYEGGFPRPRVSPR